MTTVEPITREQFNRFRKLIYEVAGISMADEKITLVASRLAKRLRHYNLSSFGKYYQLATSHQYTGEFQMMIDLLTTNETYFHREPQHFKFIQDTVAQDASPVRPYRIWSAACSSGEEVYTTGIMLAESLVNRTWEIIGSDLSSRMLTACERAIYPMSRVEKLPKHLLHKYCLKGKNEQQGMVQVDNSIRKHCKFRQLNLTERISDMGTFDMIMLRNVMIYFNAETKKQVVANVLNNLKPGGYLFISHSESLHGITDHVETVQSAVYRKKGVGY